jgi:hypothetical protein
MHVAEHSQPGILFEIPISQRLLAYITDRLSSDQKDIIMQARFRGHGEYSLQGVKKEFELSYHPFSLTTPRSEWYAQVLSQTRRGQYRFMEIKLPVSDDDLAKEWAASVEHLKSAEKAYVDCDDSEVFHYLRAALDALPGAKKDICDGISDSKKSEAINDILLKVGAYLHSGRHVSSKSNNPDEVGSFPVNRIDAAFAIDLVRTVLSHLSLMMSTDKGRL